jgi:hypothetical protein
MSEQFYDGSVGAQFLAPERQTMSNQSSSPVIEPCPFCRGMMQFRKALWPSDGCVDAIIHAFPTQCGMVEFSDGSIDESIIAKWNTRASLQPATPTAGEDGPCFYCDRQTSSLAGDPGEWPLVFCQPDGTGVVRWHHTRCVTNRLFVPTTDCDAVAGDAKALLELAQWVADQYENFAGSIARNDPVLKKHQQWLKGHEAVIRRAAIRPDVAGDVQAARTTDLTDPVVVHANMLRGTIAKPTWANIQHLYAEEFEEIGDQIKARDAQLFVAERSPDGEAASGAAGCLNQVEEAACLIWTELCPGMVMGGADLPHYEAAARAVLALRSLAQPSRKPMAYYIEHETLSNDLVFCPLSEDDIQLGWRATPLYTDSINPPPTPAIEQLRDQLQEMVDMTAPTLKSEHRLSQGLSSALIRSRQLLASLAIPSTERWTEKDLTEAKAEAKELSDHFNTWPSGCHDPDSCARHLGCMYVQCSRHNKDGNEVAKEIQAYVVSRPHRGDDNGGN